MALGQARYAQINTPMSQKLAQKKCLIAVHRGSWGGNITQNTIGAYAAALQMGADMVESDVNATTDGVLYSFHDGNEKRVFGVDKGIREMDSKEVEGYHPINTCNEPTAARINRLTEVLDFLSHGELLNIDRAWNIIPQLLEVLDRYPNAKYQVVLKAPLKAKEAYELLNAHPVKYMFMPICYSFEDVEAGIVHWPMSCIRLTCADDARLVELADKILTAWRGYTDEQCFVYAETDGEPHNTITPIARMRDGKFQLDLVLRNNITTPEHPLGVYHPHAKLHHIKKENIGLIEVMGLAVLPARLKDELHGVAQALVGGDDLRQDETLRKHADWADELKTRYTFTADNAEELLRREVGAVFAAVLEHAGVYKCTPEGREAFLRFIHSV